MSFREINNTPPNPAESIPTIREGAVIELTGAFRKAVEALHVDMFKTCMTCINFQEHSKNGLPAQWCTRFSPQVGPVPARIVAYGCREYYHNDEIPF